MLTSNHAVSKTNQIQTYLFRFPFRIFLDWPLQVERTRHNWIRKWNTLNLWARDGRQNRYYQISDVFHRHRSFIMHDKAQSATFRNRCTGVPRGRFRNVFMYKRPRKVSGQTSGIFSAIRFISSRYHITQHGWTYNSMWEPSLEHISSIVFQFRNGLSDIIECPMGHRLGRGRCEGCRIPTTTQLQVNLCIAMNQK